LRRGRHGLRPTGTWQAAGVNDRNLRAMLADPSHATRGVAARDDRGAAGTTPVTRLLAGDRERCRPSRRAACAPSPPKEGDRNAR
jgi:hypothetical protein